MFTPDRLAAALAVAEDKDVMAYAFGAATRDKINGKGLDFYPCIFRCPPTSTPLPPPPPPPPSHTPPKALQQRVRNIMGVSHAVRTTCCIDLVVHILDRFRHL